MSGKKLYYKNLVWLVYFELKKSVKKIFSMFELKKKNIRTKKEKKNNENKIFIRDWPTLKMAGRNLSYAEVYKIEY